MNYIQAYYKLPFAIVYKENKTEYINALVETREQQDLKIFRAFIDKEHTQLLKSEIERFQEIREPKKGKGFSFLF